MQTTLRTYEVFGVWPLESPISTIIKNFTVNSLDLRPATPVALQEKWNTKIVALFFHTTILFQIFFISAPFDDFCGAFFFFEISHGYKSENRDYGVGIFV